MRILPSASSQAPKFTLLTNSNVFSILYRYSGAVKGFAVAIIKILGSISRKSRRMVVSYDPESVAGDVPPSEKVERGSHH